MPLNMVKYSSILKLLPGLKIDREQQIINQVFEYKVDFIIKSLQFNHTFYWYFIKYSIHTLIKIIQYNLLMTKHDIVKTHI